VFERDEEDGDAEDGDRGQAGGPDGAVEDAREGEEVEDLLGSRRNYDVGGVMKGIGDRNILGNASKWKKIK